MQPNIELTEVFKLRYIEYKYYIYKNIYKNHNQYHLICQKIIRNLYQQAPLGECYIFTQLIPLRAHRIPHIGTSESSDSRASKNQQIDKVTSINVNHRSLEVISSTLATEWSLMYIMATRMAGQSHIASITYSLQTCLIQLKLRSTTF